MRKTFILASLLVLFSFADVNAQRITVTIAGNGMYGYSGDGGPAKLAQLGMVKYLCSDRIGNVYFVDSNNIRKVSVKNGIITNFAGGGTSTADGIPATNASLLPQSICADPSGRIYLASSSKIKIIDPSTGIINTYAGTGVGGYGGDGGPATSAQFGGISGITSDNAGNIYFVDGGNNRIRKINGATGIINTIAGTGASGYTGDGGPATAATISIPEYIGCNAAGDVFFTDQSWLYVRKITAATGYISTFAGGGSGIIHCPALGTHLGTVSGLCVNASGNVYFNEISCSCREIDQFTDSTEYLGGDYLLESFKNDTNSLFAWMDRETGVCSDAKDNVYIADTDNGRIRKLIKLTHTPTFAFGKGQTIAACSGYARTIDSLLAITDLDSAQTETWSIITPPTIGTLTGLPATQFSNGKNTTTKPSGVSYLSPSTYIGFDSFTVRVTDGTLWDTFAVYVSVGIPTIGTITTAGHDICLGYSEAFYATVPDGVWTVTNSAAVIDSGTGVLRSSSVGTDTVLYTHDAYRCPITDTYIVSVITVPSVGIITGRDTVCVGASIILTDTTGAGSWSSANSHTRVSGTGIVTGLLYGIDVINYTVAGTCGTNLAYKTIIIDSLLSAGSISGPEIVCAGASIALSDTISGGGWSVYNSHATISLSGVVAGVTPGTDTVVYAVTNSCGTATTSQEIVVNKCNDVGLPVPPTPAISIFPNPTSSVLNIAWDELYSGDATISLTDVTGRVVLRDELASNINGMGTMEVNVSGLREGIYLLTVYSDTFHFTQKVVVSR